MTTLLRKYIIFFSTFSSCYSFLDETSFLQCTPNTLSSNEWMWKMRNRLLMEGIFPPIVFSVFRNQSASSKKNISLYSLL